jgi:hypothetical protein
VPWDHELVGDDPRPIVVGSSYDWWGRSFQILYVKFTANGERGGRLLQPATHSNKCGHLQTSSAWIKVLQGGIYFGRENAWTLVEGAGWQFVEQTSSAPCTLGGAFGVGAKPDSPYAEALIAMPKVEVAPRATGWLPQETNPRLEDDVTITANAICGAKGQDFDYGRAIHWLTYDPNPSDDGRFRLETHSSSYGIPASETYATCAEVCANYDNQRCDAGVLGACTA